MPNNKVKPLEDMINPDYLNLSPASIPQSEEIETGLIGSVMFSMQKGYEIACKHIKSDNEFYYLKNKIVWQLLALMKREFPRLDVVSITEWTEMLTKMSVADNVGMDYLFTLMTNANPDPVHIEMYALYVHNLAWRRDLLRASDTMRNLALDHTKPIENVVAEGQETWLNLVSGQQAKGEWFGEIYSQLYDQTFELMENGSAMGFPTGFTEIDTLTGGFERQQFIIVCGRPAMGKTSLILGMLYNQARLGIPVALLTLEMSKFEVTRRLIAIETGIPVNFQKNPKLMTPNQVAIYTEAMGRVEKLPIFIDDTGGLTGKGSVGKVSFLARSMGIQSVYVDGVYRMSATNPHAKDVERVSEATMGLKDAAKEANVMVVATHQLNRGLEMRADKRPTLADLRDSGTAEQDTDMVFAVYRDVMYNPACEFPNQADIICLKQRDGATGTASLFFDRTLTKFSDPQIRKVVLS